MVVVNFVTITVSISVFIIVFVSVSIRLSFEPPDTVLIIVMKSTASVDVTVMKAKHDSIASVGSSTYGPLVKVVFGKGLGYQGCGKYGLESITLETSSSTVVKLNDQVVAGVVTEDAHLGILGLGPSPVNFSDLKHSVPSFLDTMIAHNTIQACCTPAMPGLRILRSISPSYSECDVLTVNRNP